MGEKGEGERKGERREVLLCCEPLYCNDSAVYVNYIVTTVQYTIYSNYGAVYNIQ